jgi:hypothetical protein
MPSEQQVREASLIKAPEHIAELIEAKDQWQEVAIQSRKRIAELAMQLAKARIALGSALVGLQNVDRHNILTKSALEEVKVALGFVSAPASKGE